MKAIIYAWSYDSHVALKKLGYVSHQSIDISEIYEVIKKIFESGLNVALTHGKTTENLVYIGADFKFPELAIDMGIKGSAHTKTLEQQ